MKTKILSWLLHHANREGKNKHFYEIKNKILSKYGKCIGYDVQFIQGKKCYSCNGSGVYENWNVEYDYVEPEECWNCYNGWYKRPVWNILKRVKFGKYVFHQPKEKMYVKPEVNNDRAFEGYIDHTRSKYGRIALHILFLLYEKGYLKRYYKQTGWGWYCYWWYPKNYINNLIHLIKHGKSSIPFIDLSAVLYKKKIDKTNSVLPF